MGEASSHRSAGSGSGVQGLGLRVGGWEFGGDGVEGVGWIGSRVSGETLDPIHPSPSTLDPIPIHSAPGNPELNPPHTLNPPKQPAEPTPRGFGCPPHSQ